MKPTLYPHQEKLKSEIYHAINHGNRRVMVKAATGLGKTVLASDIIHDAVSKGLRCVFSVPTLTLIDQTLVELSKFGLDCGVIQADHFATDYGKQVQIVSIQTIASQLKRNTTAQQIEMDLYFKDVLYIQDEAHQRFKAANWLSNHTRKPVISLSATPWAKGLGKVNDALINGPDVGWLIDNGYLSKYTAYSHYVPDMKGVQVNASGDYSGKESGDKYDTKIIGNIVGHWEKYALGKQTILFAPRVVDSERFAKEFCAAGYKAVAVSGYMDNDDCRIEVEKFKTHETTIICSVAKLTTGFDVKDVGCIIDSQPTKSLMRHVQKLGRGLRVHPDKAELIILDNSGNLLRNGLPDGNFPETLDSGDEKSRDRKEPDEPLPTACPKCGVMKPPKVYICPACQFEPEKQSTLEVEDGELVELTKTQKNHNKDETNEQKAEFYGGLKRYASDFGFNPGWAAHKYKSKFGVWPNKYKDVPMCPPSDIVLGYIKHSNIKYANRRTA